MHWQSCPQIVLIDETFCGCGGDWVGCVSKFILGLSYGTNLDLTYCVTSYIVITSNPLTVPQCISTLHVNWPMLSLTTSKWPKIKSFLSRFCSVYIEKRLQRIHSRCSPVKPINHPLFVQPRYRPLVPPSLQGTGGQERLGARLLFVLLALLFTGLLPVLQVCL